MDIHSHAGEKKISLRQIADFTSLVNPLGPSNKAKTAMRKALKTVPLFPDSHTTYLRRSIAKREGMPGDHILFGHGSTQLLELLFACSTPRRVLMPAPVPEHHERLFKRHGIEAVTVPHVFTDRFDIGIKDIIAAASRADILLIPNPHPLTGTLISADSLRALADSLNGTGKLLVVDETLLEFTPTASAAASLVGSQNVLLLRSFSLFHALAGLRLGYACAHPDLLARITRPFDPAPVSNVGAAAALASLRDTGFYRRTEEFVKAEKHYMTQKLLRIKDLQVFDTECNFVLVRLSEAVPDLTSGFLTRNILIDVFSDNHDTRFVRLPVRRHPVNARFIRTMARIMRASPA